MYGFPLITIGFNQDVAWTHTVSTADRFTLHELTLNPDNPLEYLYDGEYRQIEPRTVSVQVQEADGALTTIEHTAYLTHFGPMVDLGALNPLVGGWPNLSGTAFAMQDVNLGNMRSFAQWIGFGQATSLDELTEALRPVGIPWVNTIAADRHGNGFYGDVSTVPHVTAAKIDDCVRSPLAQRMLATAGIVVLDGSDPACAWGSDADAPVPGVFGYDNLPKLSTTEYAANANDSYWLANPRQLLTGYPRIIGDEQLPQSLRTRLTFLQAEQRLAGTDDLGDPGFNHENTRAMLAQARNYAAELLNDDLATVCTNTDWAAYYANDGGNSEHNRSGGNGGSGGSGSRDSGSNGDNGSGGGSGRGDSGSNGSGGDSGSGGSGGSGGSSGSRGVVGVAVVMGVMEVGMAGAVTTVTVESVPPPHK